MINAVVIVWVVTALAGLILAIAARQNAADELRDLGGITNGRRRLGKGHVRDETIVAVIDLAWLVIGIYYMATSTATSTSVVGYVLAATSILLSFSTYARWQDRRYVSRPVAVVTSEEQTEINAAEDLVFGDQRRDLRDEAVDIALREQE